MPTTITVSTSAQLYSALARATGGETILLESGAYGNLSLTPQSRLDRDFPSTVTIASRDPSDPAVFSGADVRHATNLTLDGITFDYAAKAGDPVTKRPFTFSGCENLTIRNSTFDGDVASGVSAIADGYGTGHGLFVRNSTGTVVENNEFHGFYRGAAFDNNDDTVVRGNDVHSMRMDGMAFSASQNVLIEGNHVHDFRGCPGSGDHCDMIQFWTTGTTRPSTDIVIRGNTLGIGEGTATQSIFMRNELVDEGRAGAEMFYGNVLIENNTITNANHHGISVGETAGLTIRKNSVLHDDGGQADGRDDVTEIPRIDVAPRSTDVDVTQNATSGIVGYVRQGTWLVGDNALVQDQDPRAANHYGNVYVASTIDDGMGSGRFVPVKNGVVDLLGAGSSRPATDDAGATPAPAPMFHVEAPDVARRVFDAGYSKLGDGDLPPGTIYMWDFGDGTTAVGLKVSHAYTGGGDYPVTLTIRLPDGRVAVEASRVAVQSANVLSLHGDGFTAVDRGAALDLGAPPRMTAEGLQLGGPGTAADVSRHHVADVVGAKEMTIGFTLDADRVGASGELFRLHGSFVASVTSGGELNLQVFRNGDAGDVNLTTRGAGLNGAVDLEKDVVVDLDDGRLTVWVDGALVGEAAMSGTVGGASGYGTHDLTFGNPWNRANFSGDLKAFDLSVGDAGYPAEPVTSVLVACPSMGPGFRMIHGTDGNDHLVGKGLDDFIDAKGGADRIYGGSAEDVLQGGAGNDFLYGGPADDVLFGGAGDDALKGDAGRDRLFGGAGKDVFRFTQGSGHDVVEDFKPGEDRLDLSSFDLRSSDLRWSRSGNDLVLRWDDAEVLLRDMAAFNPALLDLLL